MNESNNEAPLVQKLEDNAPSPARPGPGFWESVLWCLIFLGGQVCSLLVVAVGVFMLFALGTKDPKAFTDEQLNALKVTTEARAPGVATPMPHAIAESLGWGMVAAQAVSLLMILVVIPWRVGTGWRRQLGVRAPSCMHLLLVLLIVPGFVIMPESVQSLIHWITGWNPHSVGDELSGLFHQFPLVLTLLGVAIGPGIVEEFWCRGFLGRGLCARYGIAAGVFLTSLFFAVMHMNPAQLPAYICMGAYLHFVYLATRSIWPSVLLHAMNNGMAVVFSLVLSPAKAGQPTPIALEVFSFALLVFGSVALWTGRATVQPQSVDTEPTEWKPQYPGISAPPIGSGLRVSRLPISPVAFVFTVVAFTTMLYLGYRYLV